MRCYKLSTSIFIFYINMSRQINPNMTMLSKNLRKNMTKAERKLWYEFFKDLPININRQKVIGNYIVDFYCAEFNLVIELDGGQHYENEGIEKDKIRDEYLENRGYKVLRYSNLDVLKNFSGVCEDILANLKML